MKLKEIISSEKGFTLTEILIVFIIFLVISSITTFQLTSHYKSVNNRFFLTQLSNDLYFAQMYAMNNQTEVYVNFLPDKYKYYFREPRGQIFFERHYDESIWIYEGSLKLNFRFLANGNISKFGTIFVRIDGTRYRIVFQLGRGRFYIDEG